MKNIRLHPLFIALAIVMTVFSRFRLLLSSVIAVLLHEYSHHLMAKDRGYSLETLTLMPYGAVLSGEDAVHNRDLFMIALVGPLSNFLICAVCIAFWWLYPETYVFTCRFVKANFFIAVFNLLPCYPLDGARIIISLAKNRSLALKITRVTSVVISLIAFTLFIVSAFFTINFPLAIVSIMLFVGGVSEGKKERYIQLFSQIFCLKDLSQPIEKCELYVHTSTKIKVLLRMLKPTKLYTVSVVDNNCKALYSFDNAQLEELIMLPNRNITIGDALKKLKSNGNI